jgi:energy-converting hydrogenase Eha subunit A
VTTLDRAGAYVGMLSTIFSCPQAAAGLVALILVLAIAMIVLQGILTLAMPFFAGFLGRLIMNYITNMISGAILSAAKKSKGC